MYKFSLITELKGAIKAEQTIEAKAQHVKRPSGMDSSFISAFI